MSTTPSFFNVTSGTQKSIETPPGTIVPYLGTTDPDGWVICDGSQRTYDSKYDELVSLSYGTKSDSGTYYYPINLQNTFLRGGTDNLGSVIGDGTVKIPLVKHYHNIEVDTSSVHNHSYKISDISHNHKLSVSDSHNHSINSISFNNNHTHDIDIPMPQHQHGILMAADDFNYKGGDTNGNQMGWDANAGSDEWEKASACISTWDNNYNQGYQGNDGKGDILNPSLDGSDPTTGGMGTSGGLWKDLNSTTKGTYASNTDITVSVDDNESDTKSLDSDTPKIDITVDNTDAELTMTLDASGNGDSIELNPSNYTVVFIMKL